MAAEQVMDTGGVSGWASGVVSSRGFRASVIGAIVAGSLIVGLETIPFIHATFGRWLVLLDRVVIALFVVEAVLKIVAAGRKPMRYFGDPWNLFDFTITVVCLLPLDGRFAQVLRLARVARSLRLVKALPRLSLIVDALLRSLPSFGWIMLLLFLLLYVYSVMGVSLFGENDPERFGTLWASMLTMFGILTLEGWVDIMRDQMSGIEGPDGAEPLHRSPIAAPMFFVTFILGGTMVFLNLLVGVIVNSLSQSAAEADAAEAAAKSPLPTIASIETSHPSALGDRLARVEAALDASLSELRALRELSSMSRRTDVGDSKP